MKLLVLQTYTHFQLMFIMDTVGVVFKKSDLIKYRFASQPSDLYCGQMQHGGTITGHNQLSYAVLQQVCRSLVSRMIIIILINTLSGYI